jgi:hypothetical protein
MRAFEGSLYSSLLVEANCRGQVVRKICLSSDPMMLEGVGEASKRFAQRLPNSSSINSLVSKSLQIKAHRVR